MRRSTNPNSIARDLLTVNEMIDRLVPYINEKELYGLMPDSFPRLTVGAVLMLLHRLSAIKNQLAPEQQASIVKALEKMASVEHEWPVALEGKVQQEFRARLNAINRVLDEQQEESNKEIDDYLLMAKKRIILEALKENTSGNKATADEMRASLAQLDARLRACTVSSDFILNPVFANAYPKDQFWFLYVTGNLQ